MSVVGAFCNQLIRFFEELQGTFPEEKSISMALEAIKAAKKSNPKLTVDIFYRHIYIPANDLIVNRKEQEIIALTQNIIRRRQNTFVIFL